MAKKKISPHDRFIRHIFTNPKIAREFFETYLPKSLQEVMDFDALEPQPGSFIDDKLKLQISDVLFSTTFNGEEGYVYTLLEHQSSPDKMLPFRLIKYMTAIIDQHLKKKEGSTLPLIYPIILYTGHKPFTHSTDFFDLYGQNSDLARQLMGKPYQLVDLSKATDEELKQYFWFGAGALIAKHIKDPDILPNLKVAIELFRKIEKSEEKAYIKDYIFVTLSYIIEAAEVKDKTLFMQTVKDGLQDMDEEKIMTLAEMWKQEARQEESFKVARRMLEQGFDQPTISKLTDLTPEQISTLLN